MAGAKAQRIPSPFEASDWRELASARERAGDLMGALEAYGRALREAPSDGGLLLDLGRLALAMEMAPVAEGFYRARLDRTPACIEAAEGLARALAAQHRYDEAVAVLRPLAQQHPAEPVLWNTLGVIVNQMGDSDRALAFFDEALRLKPDFATALYNRSGVRMDLSDADRALTDCEAAIELAGRHGDKGSDVAMMRFAAATIRLCRGDLPAGWDAYEARLLPDFPTPVAFQADAPRWRPEDELAGKSLLVLAEQGLGDEVMFASVLPDVLDALGPNSRLALAVEPRLVALFQRSLPDAAVVPHATRREGRTAIRSAAALSAERFDLVAPLASLPRRFRRSLADFPTRPAFLVPDPARIAHWRAWLESLGAGPKVGVTWRSGKLAGERLRQYPPLPAWREALTVPGVRHVMLQYGDAAAGVEAMREAFGVELHTPPGIDLKHDLDDLAALACALDLVVGVANATTNIAAACGAPTFVVGAPAAWPCLGTDRYPWYPTARAFTAERFGGWEAPMAAVAAALREFAAR